MPPDIKQLKEELGDIKKWQVEFELYRRKKQKFINDLVCIEDKDEQGGVIDFDLWPAQEKALDKMANNRRIIFLKARQLGLTWLALAGEGAHRLVFNPGKSVSSISTTEDDTKELVRRLAFILRHLPNWLIVDDDGEPDEKKENKTGITYTEYSKRIEIHHPDSEDSIFKGYTSSPAAARSFTDNCVILDEWAFHPQAEKIWRAAYPTINRPDSGKIVGISTGERNTFFQKKWNNAEWEYGGESGSAKNTFIGIFLPWDADPRRDEEWLEETKIEMGESFRSEYPSTPSEAFTTGSGAFFPVYNSKIHFCFDKGWYPPAHFRIIGAYDGGYNRACFKWYAISNDGWIVCYREYYPEQKIDPVQAEDIRELSRDPEGAPEQFAYIVADTSCWAKNQESGKTTIEIMEEHEIKGWRQADKERIPGWKRLHEYLSPIRDEQNNIIKDRNGRPLAKLRYTDSCSNTKRLFPSMKSNETKPDDLASGQEDHVFDCDRYMVMSRPKPGADRKSKQRQKQERKRKTKPRSRATGY